MGLRSRALDEEELEEKIDEIHGNKSENIDLCIGALCSALIKTETIHRVITRAKVKSIFF